MGLLVSLLTMGVPVGATAERTQIPLADSWHIRQLADDEPNVAVLTREAAEADDGWLATAIPAQVHDILLEYGKISDPRIGKNAAECAWVGEHDWVYACTFPSPERNGGPVFLCFDGLDTLAEAYLNGQHIGSFDNMYRRYRVDVANHLAGKDRSNTLLIIFRSPLQFVNQVKAPDELAGVSKSHFLRKCHSDFGSYLGARPHSAKVGVFRDIYLDVPDRSWIEDVWVGPKLSDDLETATVQVQVNVAGTQAALSASIPDPDGKRLSAARGATSGGLANC